MTYGWSVGVGVAQRVVPDLGGGTLVDIEREVKLSGAIHSKGILILSAFLAARYARSQPLTFSVSPLLEQSYGMVDGDSTLLAELCALLCNLANSPIKQSICSKKSSAIISDQRNYYGVLGVAKNAGQKGIKDALRSLALKYQMDRNKKAAT